MRNKLLCSDIEYEKFCLYFETLSKWNIVHNLVQQETLSHFFDRHILNSLELLPFLAEKKISLADVGSGAGFPGLVLSIMGYENIVLIESLHKKCAFLTHMAGLLSLSVQVFNQRVETLDLKNRTVVCRAFAPLERILSSVHSNHFLLLKGLNFDKEIEEAQKKFIFDYTTYQGTHSKDTFIIEIKNINAKKPSD